MCFSAVASFSSAAVISGVGVATVRKARRPKQKLFASIPLIFGFQQFAEGALWITLRSGSYDQLQNAAAYGFLTAALVVWPVLIPLSMYFMEEVRKRKYILAVLIVAGIIISASNAFSLLFYDVTAQIQGFHINYRVDFPSALGIFSLLYIPSTVFPLFVSSVRRMWILGVMITMALAISVIFFYGYVISVWCFFAALISVMIYVPIGLPPNYGFRRHRTNRVSGNLLCLSFYLFQLGVQPLPFAYKHNQPVIRPELPRS